MREEEGLRFIIRGLHRVGGRGPIESQVKGFGHLLSVWESQPDSRDQIQKFIRRVFEETDFVTLFSRTGINREWGFLGELFSRVSQKMLPNPRGQINLSEALPLFFSKPSDALWLEKLGEDIAPTLASLGINENERIRESVRESLIVLSSDVESLGLSHDIRVRGSNSSIFQSPFVRLRGSLQRLIEDEMGEVDPSKDLELCRETMKQVVAHMEDQGVSLAIVYRLEQMELLLNRIEKLVNILRARNSADVFQSWVRLLAELVRNAHHKKQIRDLLRENLNLLSRKIVERTGVSGEQYIARSRRDYFSMLASAGGGGVLTAGTTVVKFAIGKLQPPLFFEGLLSWINYSGSFILMQSIHFTLATKQPSMTAPALASKLRNLRDESQVQEFVDEVARLVRSQVAAALGNIGMVVPTAILLDSFFVTLRGVHLLDSAYSEKVVDSLHLLASGTLPFAALTGVILWVSSIAAGWLENWFVFRRMPEAISDLPWLQVALGSKRAGRVGQWAARSISGIGGSLALGLQLAAVPVVGKIFGLALDVRHVTLSAGALTFAILGASPGQLSDGAIAGAVLGVLGIGLLNFGVSFALASYVALRARKISPFWLRRLRHGILQRLRYRPADFLVPGERA